MKNFNFNFIKARTSNGILYRGERVYRDNFLTLTSKEIINMIDEHHQLIIIFSCLSSQSNEKYKVELCFLNFNNVVQLDKVKCSCMYFLIHRNDCKHIIGALLYCVYKSNDNFLQWSGLLQSNFELINFFKMQSLPKTKVNDTINCKITCEIINDTNAKLSFSVGVRNFKEVQDINEFLNLLTSVKPTSAQERRFANLYGFPLIPKLEQYSSKFQILITFLHEETEVFNHAQVSNFNYVYHKNKTNLFNMLALPYKQNVFLK